MGDYADFVNERLIDDHFNDIDNPDPEDTWVDGQTIYTSNKKESSFPLEQNFDYIKFPIEQFKIGDEWLMRKDIVQRSTMNQTVFIKKITEKAVLFEFSEEWINIYNWQMKGKQFWLPMSILYKHKKHIKVIYIPKWVSIKIINNRPDEKRIRVYKDGAVLEDKI